MSSAGIRLPPRHWAGVMFTPKPSTVWNVLLPSTLTLSFVLICGAGPEQDAINRVVPTTRKNLTFMVSSPLIFPDTGGFDRDSTQSPDGIPRLLNLRSQALGAAPTGRIPLRGTKPFYFFEIEGPLRRTKLLYLFHY